MILNTQMTTPQSSGIMDSQQCENFYLKRKLGPEDQIDNNNGFVQPKKRHLQGYSLSENAFQSIGSDDGPQQQPDQQHQDFSSTFINDLFSYDNSLVPVQTTFSNDQFDGNWQNSDLLELDHRYNSGLVVVTNEDASQLNQDTANKNNNKGTNNVQVGMQSCASSASSQQQREIKQNLSSIFSMQNQNHQSHHRSSAKYNSDTECDFEDKNLSWLFNFKLDELPHLSPEINQIQPTPPPSAPVPQQSTKPATKNNISTSENSMVKSQAKSSQVKTVKKFEELVMEVTSELDANDMVVGENVVVENTLRMPKKPPFTYTELIEYALEDKGELTVSGIYQWISDRFPFYKSNDDRWKNSVRHNLSINPHFRKGVKAPQGAGHLWTISSGDSEENILAWEHKKQRLDLFFKMESLHRERYESSSSSRDQNQQMFDEAAIAAATITQEMNTSISSELTIPSNDHSSSTSCSPSSSSTSDRLGTTLSVSSSHELPFNDLITDEDLRKTAGQILNGIHRDVEVQAVNSIISTYHDSYLDTEDYLNPIHKDVSVHESGLRSELYVTEIDPIELGIQVEEEGLFNDEFNLNYFGYNAGNDIVA